jgi:proteasome accessory factor B
VPPPAEGRLDVGTPQALRWARPKRATRERALEKTERLLDLIALFLDAREPVSWSDLREAFPDEYGRGASAAAERKFERDKAELADLGIALDYRPSSDESKEGYVLLREEYYLPEIRFEPDEMAVLYAAGSAALASGAFPGRADLAHALHKIAFVGNEDPAPATLRLFVEHAPAKSEVAGMLEQLWQALLAHKRVRLRYRGVGRERETVREVEPWGLCLRRGVWVLVGFCRLRKAKRTFHVDRIVEISVNPTRPRTPDYEVPKGFDIAEVAREQVWEHRFHPAMSVEIGLSGDLAPLAARLFPSARVEERAGSARVTVKATYLDGLLRRVLALGESASVFGPAEATRRFAAMLRALEQGHSSRGEEARA